MGYIIVIARLPRIYGNVNCPCPRASPSDSGQFTAINPWPRATVGGIKTVTFPFCSVFRAVENGERRSVKRELNGNGTALH